MTRADRLRIEAMGRELERARAWLRHITLRARGLGRDLAVIALYDTKGWPHDIARPERKTNANRNRK